MLFFLTPTRAKGVTYFTMSFIKFLPLTQESLKIWGPVKLESFGFIRVSCLSLGRNSRFKVNVLAGIRVV